MQRNQDSVNPWTHADIMVLLPEVIEGKDPKLGHPYWYAWVVGIFHAKVRYIGPGSSSTNIQKVDFLWVRWFGCNLSTLWKVKASPHWFCGFRVTGRIWISGPSVVVHSFVIQFPNAKELALCKLRGFVIVIIAGRTVVILSILLYNSCHFQVLQYLTKLTRIDQDCTMAKMYYNWFHTCQFQVLQYLTEIDKNWLELTRIVQ